MMTWFTWVVLGAVAASAVIVVLAAAMRSIQVSQIDDREEQIRRCQERTAPISGPVSRSSGLVFCETCGRWKRPDELCRIATTAEDR